MTHVQQIHLPGQLVRDREINLANTFEWGHLAVCTAPSGERYVLSDLLYNYYRYDKSDPRRPVEGQILTRYDASGAVICQVFVPGGTSFWGYPARSLSLLPDGSVLFSRKDNRAYRFDPALTSATQAAAPGCPGEPVWAFRTRLTPTGRAVCLLGENVVAVSDEPVRARMPSLSAVTAMSVSDDVFWLDTAYCPPANAAGEGTPRSVLKQELDEAFPRHRVDWLHDVVPLDDDIFVVLAIGWKKGAYKRGGHFVFALMDANGKVRGRLDLDTYRDAAARGIRYDVVVDQRRRRVFHLNTFGLYVFDDTGARIGHLSTGDKAYRPLKDMQLREFDPTGNLVLVHEKKHLMLTIPVPDRLTDLPDVVVDSLDTFRKTALAIRRAERSRDPELGPNSYWTADAPLATFDPSTMTVTPREAARE